MYRDLRLLTRLLLRKKRLALRYVFATCIVAARGFMITYLIAYISKIVLKAIEFDSGMILTADLIKYLFWLFMFLAIDAFGKNMQGNAIHEFANQLRESIMDGIIHASISNMELIAQRAEVISRLNSDVDAVSNLLNSKVLTFVMYIISGVGAAIVLLDVDYVMFAIIVIIGVIVLRLNYKIAPLIRKTRSDYQEIRAQIAGRMEEAKRLSSEIKLMNLSEKLECQFDKELCKYDLINKKLASASIKQGAILQLIKAIELIGAPTLGTLLYGFGRISIADIIYVSEIAPLMLNAISSIGEAFLSLQNALPSVKRVISLISLEREDDGGIVSRFQEQEEMLICQNAGLIYSSGAWGYRNLNIKIKAHCITGIYGKSGGGKSSLLKSILKLYVNTEGAILLFGVDIREYSTSFIRNNVTYIPQENLIFEGTVLDNLLLGMDRTVQQKEIWDLLELIGCAQWIREAGGLDVCISEGGTNLSGGQRQQIAIARALLANKGIIMMDESFAGIDKEHIVCIMNILQEIKNRRSIVIVSHDKTVLDLCDEIVEI